jgi:hypothetical protein
MQDLKLSYFQCIGDGPQEWQGKDLQECISARVGNTDWTGAGAGRGEQKKRELGLRRMEGRGRKERGASETWEMVASKYRKVKCFTWNGRLLGLNGRFKGSTVDGQSVKV